VDLRDSGTVSLLGQFEACRPVAAASAAQTTSNKVRIARQNTVPARSEAHLWVVSFLAGMCLIKGNNRVRASPVTMASGVAEVHTEVPFILRLINPSQRDSVLWKGMVVGQAAFQPEQILYLGNGPEGVMEQAELKDPADLPKEKIPWEEQVGLTHLSEKERRDVLAMLRPHREMWDGRLGNVTAKSHRIDLTPGGRPVHAHPYRAGTRAR
jgi:hypothetical protein